MPPTPVSSPFRQFLLKMHSRCDLACSYCYVYEHVDQSWRRQPAVMSTQVLMRTAARIGEHVRIHRLPAVTLVLHGGEPLLAGADALVGAAVAVRAAVPPETHVDVHVQTNGVLLTPRLLDSFLEHDIMVGVSLDGGPAEHDRHRRFRHGGGSYQQVARGLDLLRSPRYSRLFSGLLATIDLANDPLAVYQALLSFQPPRIDFLLPHGNWTTPPPGRQPGDPGTPYADWLHAIFLRWYEAPRREADVRLFSSIIELLLGGRSRSEAVGLEPIDFLIIETDGSIEQGDALKTTAAGMAATGLTVADHSFDEVLSHPGVQARQAGLAALGDLCRSCAVVEVCGGGLYAHRYRESDGFANPSVYCADLFALITRLRARLAVDLHALARAAPPTHWPPTRAVAATPGAGRGGRTNHDQGSTVDSTGVYHLDEVSFRALGRGTGDDAVIALLVSAQASKRLLLLAAVHDLAASTPQWTATGLAPAWRVLETVTEQGAGAAGAVLAHPFVDAWAMHCLRLLRAAGERGPGRDGSAGPGVSVELAAELGYLGGLAVAAAVRAGIEVELTVSTRDGQLYLPTVGLAHGLGDGPATVRSAAGRLHVTGSAARIEVAAPYAVDQPHWCAVREMPGDSVAGRLTVAVEDLDPYRTCFRLPAADRLPLNRFVQFRAAFAGAWGLIAQHHSDYAPTVRIGLRSVVPARTPESGSVSASAQTAFGSVAVSLPEDEAALALLLIHETQHMKLSAVLDLIDLYDPSARELHHAPWRADPRPVGALFQGAYAHLAVADFWRRQRTLEREPSRVAQAQFEFAYWLAQTEYAVDQLSRSDALTGHGRRFVGEMAASLGHWRRAETVAARVTTGVRDLVDAVAVRWRLANFRDRPADVATLAQRFLSGASCPRLLDAHIVAGAIGGAPALDGLAARVRSDLTATVGAPRPNPAERAYLAGNFTVAASRYSRQVAADPARDDAWAGLALSLRRSGAAPAALALLERPDLVRGTFARVRAATAGRNADPRGTPAAVAAWLATALAHPLSQT